MGKIFSDHLKYFAYKNKGEKELYIMLKKKKKNPSLKATWNFWSFEHKLSVLPIWCPTVNAGLLHLNLVSVDWLCCTAG